MNTKRLKITILASLLSLFAIVSCKKDDDNPNNSTQTTVQNNVKSGE